MRYLFGLLVAIIVSLSASAVAAAQTPSPTATQTSVPTPTAPPSASPTPSTPPFNGAVPVIVDIIGSLGPGPITSVKPEVFWKGVGDTSVNYEVERSGTDNAATRDFQRLATIPGNAPAATGLFSYFDADRRFENVACYRVRAVSGSLASAYSAEYCLPIPPIPPRSGPGVGQAPSAPATGSGVAPKTANTAPLLLGGVALMSPFVAWVVASKRRRCR